MELTQLRYFKAAAEYNNLSEAAEKLHVSQPALSLAVKKLEEELGVPLFDRSKNKICLNDTGRLALTYAETILAKADEMKNTFYQFIRRDDVLSLGFCDPGPMRFSVPLLQKANPDINVTSALLPDESNLEALLSAHKYDAVISIRKPQNENIVTVPFAEEELMLSVPAGHPLAAEKSVCLHRERDLQLINYSGDGAYVRQIQPFIDWVSDKFGMKTYNDYFVFRQLLENGNRLCFTTKLVRNYRNDGANRVIIPLEDEGLKATYYLSYLKSRQKYLSPLLAWVKDVTKY